MEGFNTIEEVLDDLRQGKIVLVTDDESRQAPHNHGRMPIILLGL